MVVINCTKKLLNRINYDVVVDAPISTNALGAWCANVFNISRYPFVLLTNELTLLCVLFPLKEFKNINIHFIVSLDKQFKELQIPKNVIDIEIGHASEIVLSDKTNRSTLGSMNDLVFQIKSIVDDRDSFTVTELERELRRIPFSSIKYFNSNEAVKAALKISSPA